MRFIIVFSILLLLNTTTAANQIHPTSEDHSHITVNPELSFADVLNLAIKRSPNQTLITGHQANAERQRHHSDLWFANRPKLTVSHWDTVNHNDESVRETAIGVELSLRSRREKTLSKTLANIAEGQVLIWQDFLRWQLQGELRRLLFNVESAQIKLQSTLQHREATRRLYKISQLKMSAGEISHQAVTLSEIHSLQAEQTLITAEADLIDAERSYRFFTGISQRPAINEIELTPGVQLHGDHPKLLMLRSELAIRKTKLDRLQRLNKGTTTVELGVKRERDSIADDTTDTVGIGLRLPIGSSKYRYSDNHDLINSIAEADTDLQIQKRALEQNLHELQHELKVLGQNIALSAQRLTLNRTQVERALKAFELGEADINSVIRAQNNYQKDNALSQIELLERQYLIFMTHHTRGDAQ